MPAYSGLLPAQELLDLLNQLLEGERAGARGITETCLPLASPADHEALREIAADEGRFCSMLYRHIVRLDGTPSLDRKSTRLNSSHDQKSYAVFCLKKKKKQINTTNS